uniref:Uncharacterized protein n=1 Tax=Oryza sativa subsp. japonica TaxID=39947 RepID=Q10RY6_ORYSJ|nr:hypothetical protein LOC_Os03g04820 [Oryza sativa Japonica Group]
MDEQWRTAMNAMPRRHRVTVGVPGKGTKACDGALGRGGGVLGRGDQEGGDAPGLAARRRPRLREEAAADGPCDGEMSPDMELDATARSSHGGRAPPLRGGNEAREGGSTGGGFYRDGVGAARSVRGGRGFLGARLVFMGAARTSDGEDAKGGGGGGSCGGNRTASMGGLARGERVRSRWGRRGAAAASAALPFEQEAKEWRQGARYPGGEKAKGGGGKGALLLPFWEERDENEPRLTVLDACGMGRRAREDDAGDDCKRTGTV